LRYWKAEKVFRHETPPVATRRGRPVKSSGTEAVRWNSGAFIGGRNFLACFERESK
jgi:hypothetical protein